MRKGDCMILPCGWTMDPRVRGAADTAAPPQRGLFVIVLSHKGDSWDLSIVNDGSDPYDTSIHYHPAT